MIDRGHAAVEFALAVAVLLLPTVVAVAAFGPWSEHRVIASAIAAEAARSAVLSLDPADGVLTVDQAAARASVDDEYVMAGFCGATPLSPPAVSSGCLFERGTTVEATVMVWTPLFKTPWGEVGGLWVTATHSEPIDLYRSFP